MNIVVREDLKSYIEPLTPDEHDALERSLLAEGCRDALVLWGDVLVDGHNRFGLCQKHGLPFNTVQNPRFQSIEDVHLWMIDQHLGRRSVSDYQRGVLALRKKEIVAARESAAKAAKKDAHMRAEVLGQAEPTNSPIDGEPVAAAEPPIRSREDIAKAARLSPTQVTMIEKIQKQAAPELVAAVRSGTISLNAAAAVASLPVDEQVAAASAGRDELKQAAKRVREATKKPARGGQPDAHDRGAGAAGSHRRADGGERVPARPGGRAAGQAGGLNARRGCVPSRERPAADKFLVGSGQQGANAGARRATLEQ